MSDINEFNSNTEQNDNLPGGKPKNFKKRGKRKLIVVIVLILFVVTGVAGISFAKSFRDKHRGDGPFGFLMERVVKELNLTEQQQTEVNKIKDEIKSKMDANRQKRMDNANDFEQMFRSDTFDKQKASDFAKLHEADREEMRSFMIDEMAKFHSILTPDQRNKAMDKMKEMREKREKIKDKWDKREKK